MLVAGVLGGCAPKKSSNSAQPSAAASYPAPYGQSAKLAANLAALDQVSGPIVGTMKVGSDSRPLTGLVSIKSGATRIRMLEGDPTTYISDEIVVGGHRYTSPDDSIWIDRGATSAGGSLVKALAAANTTVDSGIGTVTGISAHKIVTPADQVDVAPALGIDTWTFDEETTTLRIWADDAGKPIGFGASMSWKVTLGGQSEDVALDFDVVFAAEQPDEILDPAKAWPWKEDKAAGIALADPGDLAKVKVTVSWKATDAGKLTLSEATKEFVDGMGSDTPSGTQSIVMGSEDAYWMSVNRTELGDYVVVGLVVHETVFYDILVSGNKADHAAIDAQAIQIFSTVEFTR
jgi:hypothetical protein